MKKKEKFWGDHLKHGEILVLHLKEKWLAIEWLILLKLRLISFRYK